MMLHRYEKLPNIVHVVSREAERYEECAGNIKSVDIRKNRHLKNYKIAACFPWIPLLVNIAGLTFVSAQALLKLLNEL